MRSRVRAFIHLEVKMRSASGGTVVELGCL